MYKFNVARTANEIINWIRDFFKENGEDCNAVVGISGGKDSSVVAALCERALGKDRVIGVLMPNGEQDDIDCSHLLCSHLGIKKITVNIGDVTSAVLSNINKGIEKNRAILMLGGVDSLVFDVSNQTTINLPARIRMATLYAVSQSVNGRVANTCNLSEDWVGYATRYGDAVGDFSPLSQLTTDEVVAIGEYLKLPVELTRKTPQDGLCGLTDEDNLGFTYAVLNKYIRTGVCDDADVKEKIDSMHEKNLFKLQLMPYYNPTDLSVAI